MSGPPKVSGGALGGPQLVVELYDLRDFRNAGSAATWPDRTVCTEPSRTPFFRAQTARVPAQLSTSSEHADSTVPTKSGFGAPASSNADPTMGTRNVLP